MSGGPSAEANGPSRSILLIAHFYPPAREVAANRPFALAKGMGAIGHKVTVLTSAAYGTLPDDAEQNVIRTNDLQLIQARLRGSKRADATFDSTGFAENPHIISKLVVPDAHRVAWTPFARRAALKLAGRRPFDCVITTSPPESIHSVGAALSRHGVPWLADLRDSWVFESMKDRIWIWPWQHRYSERMERRLLGHADGLVTVTPPMADDLRERLGLKNVSLVPNGWDPDAGDGSEAGGTASGGESGDDDAAAGRLDPDRVSIVYTGQLGGARRDPAPLIEGLAELARTEPELAAKLELAFAGSFSEAELALMATDVSPARILMLGALPRSQALALQRAADAALLVTGPRVQEASAKLYEYFGAGVPVLALAHPETAAARIVADSGAGLVINPREPAEVLDGLRTLARGDAPAGLDPAGRLRYAWPASAELMAAAVERAIMRRRARAPR